MHIMNGVCLARLNFLIPTNILSLLYFFLSMSFINLFELPCRCSATFAVEF